MQPASLNRILSTRSMKRRFEVWFLRFVLADGSGAWWLRYLLLNLGRSCFGGCGGDFRGFPIQIWATWFPRDDAPQSFVAGFSQADLVMSERFASPFFLEFSGNRIEEDFCRADFQVEGHRFSWDLRYRSTFALTMSDKGWLGFSRTPHADAVFSGRISFDDRTWEAEPLGFGLQGHNCGYRHSRLWTWAHMVVPWRSGEHPSSFEALEYEMSLGLRFRRAIVSHEGKRYAFGRVKTIERTNEPFRWAVHCSRREDATTLVAILDGTGLSTYRVAYLKTNCSGAFEVIHNSLTSAKLYLKPAGQPPVELLAPGGAGLEMAGQ